jgi:tetratricopeptide (TPR) repeat protein
MRIAAFLIAFLPGMALAAGGGGGGSTGKPATTSTTKTCTGSQVWDAGRKKCVDSRGSSLSDDILGEAVRELAYAGRLKDAQAVLAAMQDQTSDLALTYWGFTHRKLGDMDKARAFYERAIEVNPDNLLARSYMGQGFVEAGQMMRAKTQLAEIRARGGTGSWPEVSLATAIETGETYNY